MSSASILGSERMDGHSTEALALGDTALAAHDKLLGRHHAWTKESARVTADAQWASTAGGNLKTFPALAVDARDLRRGVAPNGRRPTRMLCLQAGGTNHDH